MKKIIGKVLRAIQITALLALFPIANTIDTINRQFNPPGYYTIEYLRKSDHAILAGIAAIEIGLAVWLFGWWSILLMPIVGLVYFVPAVEKWWNSMIKWAQKK